MNSQIVCSIYIHIHLKMDFLLHDPYTGPFSYPDFNIDEYVLFLYNSKVLVIKTTISNF